MAQYRCCATSPLTGKINIIFRLHRILLCTVIFNVCPLLPYSAEAGLYTQSDQIILLNQDNIDSVLYNSSAALLVEFYASWCGHCVAFSPLWKSLARDTKEWKPAVDLAAIDCADEDHRTTCFRFGIRGYPTLKFFHAYSEKDSKGVSLQGSFYDTAHLRHQMISMIEKHKDVWPPACPPLEAASIAEIDAFFETNSVQHLALVFEKADSYVGREVTLDLLQFENIAVRRVLDTEEGLVDRLGVTDFPSCYVYSVNGSFSRLSVHHEARTFYSYALQGLPGVVRAGKPKLEALDISRNDTEEPWRHFNRSRVYMSDLESSLHFSLRVEAANHPTISAGALIALKRYISVLAKYFPGRPVVKNLLQSVDTWLKGHREPEVPYSSLRAVLDNAGQTAEAVLPQAERWVACQGSQAHFRRYPCSVWTLFHVLSVEAANTSGSDPQEVLQALRSYVRHFFGCRPCATHFESMAQESMSQVKAHSDAVLWLWSRHNRVNNRLAGALSEDPHFPKVQWPSPEMCPKCHGLKSSGEHTWEHEEVLAFLMEHYSSSRILHDYLEPEDELLRKHRENLLFMGAEQEAKLSEGPEDRAAARVGRDTRGRLEQEVLQEEPDAYEEGDKEEMEEDQEPGLDRPTEAVAEEEVVTMEPQPWARQGAVRALLPRPVIVGLRPRVPREEIVDLDSFVQQHYKAEALRAAGFATSLSRVRRALRQDQGLGLEPMEPDAAGEGKWLKEHSLLGREAGFRDKAELLGAGRRRGQSPWMSALALGFSRLDVSLCALLYVLSSLCLLAMYRCFRVRARLRPAKVALP